MSIKHSINEHTDEAEKLRGQVPLADEDFELAADVINNYDGDIDIEKNKRGQNVIIYHKAYPDGRILYVEEIRGKRHGELAFVSMRKYKQKKGESPNETTSASTLGSPDLSEGKK